MPGDSKGAADHCNICASVAHQ